MNPSPQVSRAAHAAGVSDRFLYWFGRSGRRYLFTRAGDGALADFGAGVAIAVSGDTVIWCGEVETLARFPATSAVRQASVYVHLLSPTPAERRTVIEDLRPSADCSMRLAA